MIRFLNFNFLLLMSSLIFKKYIRYTSLNSWAVSVSSVISTNSMLSTISTVSPSYTDMISTTYIGKDIIGQLGGLYYSFKTSQKADKQPNKYIKNGALLCQLSFFIENSTPLIKNPDFILPFLGFSSFLKNISFISIGAVNASNLQKLSLENKNIGESYSKIASLNTLASTAGMITGIFILNLIPSYTVRTVFFLPILSFISVFSLKKATDLLQK